MDKKFTSFLTKELQIGKVCLAPIDILLFAATAVFGIMLRLSVVSYAPIGFPAFLRLAGVMKPISMVFDFLLSIVGGLFVFRLTKEKLKGYLAYTLLFLLPVVCAQSAMWGMGDSIYVFFAVLALFLLYLGKGNAALVAYGISLFLNRYAFFLLPVFALAYLQKKNRLYFWLFPFCGAWFRCGFLHKQGLLSIPVFEMERLFQRLRPEVLLSYNWPNLYQIMGPDKFVMEYGMVAKGIAVALMAVFVVYAYQAKKDVIANLLPLCVFSCMLFPFVMPQMDERAGFLADVLVVIFAMQYMELFYVAVFQVIISYIAYSAYFREESVLPLGFVALASLGLVLLMAAFAFGGRKISIRLEQEGSKQDRKKRL